jgi:hypothetical protein
MTIVQYLPQWLRSRSHKPAPQKLKSDNKKVRQVLPPPPKPQALPAHTEDEESAARSRIYWRM